MKSILMFTAILAASQAGGQTIFSEDFEAGIPGTFTLVDNDGLTPAAPVSYVTSAWVARANFDDNLDTVAVSNSWYDPIACCADDWMITPAINLTDSNILIWNAKAQDPSWPDGYEVKISTTNTALSSFTTNLFSIVQEQASWISRSVDLGMAGFANQTVYIAFRNNSNDKFLLLIDDIVVTEPFNDAAITSGNPSTFTQIPLRQVAPIALGAMVNNSGLASTGARLRATVKKDGSTVLVDSSGSGNLATGSNTLMTLSSPFTPSGTGTYEITYSIRINEPDNNSPNDTRVVTFVVTDSTYAIDNGIFAGAVGFNTTTGSLGQQFTLNVQDTLKSISFFVRGDHTGQTFSLTVYPAIDDTTTATPLYTSPVMTFDGTEDSVWKNYSVTPTVMAPGKFLVTVDQLDAVNIQLAYDNNPDGRIIGSPQWTIYNQFGSPFIRLNLGNPPPPPSSAGPVIAPEEFSVYPNPSSGTFSVELSGNTNAATAVVVTDVAGKEVKTLTIPPGKKSAEIVLSGYPDGAYFIQVNGGARMEKVILSR